MQDRLFKGTKMTIYNQSLYVTLCSAGLSLAGVFCTPYTADAQSEVHAIASL